jgi:hypothetical protein
VCAYASESNYLNMEKIVEEAAGAISDPPSTAPPKSFFLSPHPNRTKPTHPPTQNPFQNLFFKSSFRLGICCCCCCCCKLLPLFPIIIIMTTDLTQRRFLRASSPHLQQQCIFYRKRRKKAIELCKRPPQRCGFFTMQVLSFGTSTNGELLRTSNRGMGGKWNGESSQQRHGTSRPKKKTQKKTKTDVDGRRVAAAEHLPLDGRFSSTPNRMNRKSTEIKLKREDVKKMIFQYLFPLTYVVYAFVPI